MRVFPEFGECIAEVLDDDGNEVGEEAGFGVEFLAAEAHGAAEDSAEDVAAAFVGGCCAVRDSEGERADVVGDDAIGGVHQIGVFRAESPAI